MLPYLTRLTIRLASGTASWDREFREQTAAFFLAAQVPGGGFVGRKGTGDLYYTGFALRGLSLLGALTDDATSRNAEIFLADAIDRPLAGIDILSLLFGALLLEMASGRDLFETHKRNRAEWAFERLSALRQEDGGFAASASTHYSSTYHTFLAIAASELIGPDMFLRSEEECERLLAMLSRRERPEGGFVELDALRNPGTNPTTAALGLLEIVRGRFETFGSGREETVRQIDAIAERSARFLKNQYTQTGLEFRLESGSGPTRPRFDRGQSLLPIPATVYLEEGGFRANTRIPVPDLLSTATTLIALAEREVLCRSEKQAVLGFARSLRKTEPGRIGYTGGAWDEEPDVEFTFYGLVVESLLAEEPPV